MKRIAILACACVATIASAQQKSITDQAAMDKLLATIPVNSLAMPYKNLLERFDNLGITAKHVMYGTVTADEVQINPDKIKRGDVLYRFSTSEPSERAKKDCAFMSSFTLTKRGDRWLVESRTANYMLQNQCSIPK